jgi:hypothetical protein
MFLRNQNYNLLNQRVQVIDVGWKKRYGKTLHKEGTVIRIIQSSEVGVLLDGLYNSKSSNGLFWFTPNQLKILNIMDDRKDTERMDGNYKVAKVEIMGDKWQTKYAFALFDDANVGDMVVVNSRETFALATIKEIVLKEDYIGCEVTKEVIDIVDMTAFNIRISDRVRKQEIEKEKSKLKAELDKRISKLKDIEFYEKMATQLADKDPELAEMASRLKELTI